MRHQLLAMGNAKVIVPQNQGPSVGFKLYDPNLVKDPHVAFDLWRKPSKVTSLIASGLLLKLYSKKKIIGQPTAASTCTCGLTEISNSSHKRSRNSQTPFTEGQTHLQSTIECTRSGVGIFGAYSAMHYMYKVHNPICGSRW